MIITIHRAKISPVTTGMMDIDGYLFGVTLERPWRNNERKISCIPAGDYTVAFTPSPKFKRHVLEVQWVPGRDGIRIHSANYVHELEGCIAVASKFLNPNVISGSLVMALELKVMDATRRGETVTLRILNPEPAAV